MHVLGLSFFYHDSAAAILRDGELIAAAAEERFSRVKHDHGFPALAVEFCLRKAGIAASDLDYVVFYEKPFVKFERILLCALQTFPRSWKVFRESMLTWLTDKLWVKDLIRERLRVERGRILFADHHMSHAASAFYCSPFEEAAVLTVDGAGEWTTATMGVGRGTEIRIDREMRFPHSVGLLYSAFTAFCGFEVNEGEYKLMGMAPYGKPKHVDKVKEVVKIAEDGSIWHDMSFFSYHWSPASTLSKKFLDLFGPVRELSQVDKTLDPYYADVAASIQVVTEEILIRMARTLRRDTGLKRLCMAGGCALNSVANAKILRESGFEELFVHPAAGDDGGAVGAAMWAYHGLLGKPRRFVLEHAYWGEEYGEGEIADFLRREGIPHVRLGDDEKVLDRTVEALVAGRVVGWYDGRFEWGPRALGSRSILADPRRAEMKDVVNAKIKFREAFRPFAPSVIVEKAREYFELDDPARHYPARFMLYVVPVVEGKRETIPAITHVDGTGRLQTVHAPTSPRYHRLISRFGEATGVPVLLNTSFNLKGEPIVTTPENAYRTFMRSGMDLLVLKNHLVTKDGGKS
ncbi:MAG TPA: carbamoyltransferase [Planctomycetota bacterium]|nr:carbamoyltransferase [Planctomycetota bacterium]